MVKILFFCAALSVSVVASDSPQRDLYKLDYRDQLFNTMTNPESIEQNKVLTKERGRGDGSRMLNELNQKIQKHERIWK